MCIENCLSPSLFHSHIHTKTHTYNFTLLNQSPFYLPFSLSLSLSLSRSLSLTHTHTNTQTQKTRTYTLSPSNFLPLSVSYFPHILLFSPMHTKNTHILCFQLSLYLSPSILLTLSFFVPFSLSHKHKNHTHICFSPLLLLPLSFFLSFFLPFFLFFILSF